MFAASRRSRFFGAKRGALCLCRQRHVAVFGSLGLYVAGACVAVCGISQRLETRINDSACRSAHRGVERPDSLVAD